MIVSASIYIGDHSYLLDVSEDKSHYATQIEAAFEAGTNLVEEDIYVSLNPNTLNATLTFDTKTYSAFQFVKCLTPAEDVEGLPILLYIDAHFSIDDEIDFDELDSDSSVTLQIGTETIGFYGSLEQV
jgi:hypothetical protein